MTGRACHEHIQLWHWRMHMQSMWKCMSVSMNHCFVAQTVKSNCWKFNVAEYSKKQRFECHIEFWVSNCSTPTWTSSFTRWRQKSSIMLPYWDIYKTYGHFVHFATWNGVEYSRTNQCYCNTWWCNGINITVVLYQYAHELCNGGAQCQQIPMFDLQNLL